MQFEQLETAEGLVLRSSPTPEEWRRTRLRLVVAAASCTFVGAGLAAAEYAGGVRPTVLVLIPLAIGVVWSARFARTLQRARPTALVATDHSLRLERLDGSRHEDLDLSIISSIRIGPDGFAVPWRWLKGPRDGLVVLRLRGTDQGFVIPAQIATHPVTRQLLARILAASRARGPVSLLGPSQLVSEIEQLARDTVAADAQHHVPPITIPAGWYPDPARVAAFRWWDGRAWSEHTRDAHPEGAWPNGTHSPGA